MSRLFTYDEAIAAILNRVSALPSKPQPLLAARGMILAEDIITPYPIPPFANSAMDGFAVRSGDTSAARIGSPVRLPIIAEITAGSADIPSLAAMTSIRIITGAPMPPFANAVIPIEDVTVSDGAVLIETPVEPGAAVRPAGDDRAAGETLVAVGSELNAGTVALCAAAGRDAVLVYARPKVAVITTGDELAEPGGPLESYQIYNSNAYGLTVQVEEAGGEVVRRLHAADSPEALRLALDSCADADAIVTSGGVSVGKHDYVKSVVSESGELQFWRAAIRPGKPIAFGRYGRALFFGLPGNPVSTFVTFELFVRPTLRKLLGCAETMRPQVTARLTETARHEPGRRSFQRAVVTQGDAAYTARACAHQGSHQLSTLAEANSLLIIPEDVAEIAVGETARVILLDR